MSARILLIRHGLTDTVNRRIMGRLAGVHLNDAGRAQARRLCMLEAHRIYSSPLERAVETAEPLAQQRGVTVAQCEAFNEIDFGDWSGKTLQELESVPEWTQYNRVRSCSAAPGGEMLLDVQRRVVAELNRIASEDGEGIVAVFTHADVIRAAVLHYLGAPLDLIERIEISPASVTSLNLYDWGPRIVSVNGTVQPPA